MARKKVRNSRAPGLRPDPMRYLATVAARKECYNGTGDSRAFSNGQSRTPIEAEPGSEVEYELCDDVACVSPCSCDDEGPDSNCKEPGPGNADPPLPKTEKPGSGTTGAPSSQVTNEGATNSLPPPPTKKSTKAESKPKPEFPPASPKVAVRPATPLQPVSSADSKRAPTSSQPRTLGPTPAPSVLVKSVPPSEATAEVPSSSKAQNTGPSPAPRTRLSSAKPQGSPNPTKAHNTTPLVGGDTSEKVSQGGPPDQVDVNNKSNPGEATTAKDPSPPRVVELGPNENGALTQSGDLGLPARSSPRSCRSDIESLYALSPPNMAGEIEPIDLESDPDFEMMERMLLSHRGPQSSQPVKEEPPSQPLASFKNSRLLKRQRSHPSLPGSSQAPAQEPRAGSKPVKRPRVKGPSLNDRKKHEDFWDLDGTVVLQVENVIFRVMRSTLSKASPWFRKMFNENFDQLEIMAGCPVYTVEEDLSHLDLANLLCGLENGLEYALNPPHYLRILSIFRAASLLEFGTLQRWSLGCLEKQWPADLPPPSKPSKFGSMIPWAEETLILADQLDVPQLAKRAYWELCTRPELRRIDAEVYDSEVESIMPVRSRLPRSIISDLIRLRERLLPEWTRITRSPPVGVPCARAMNTPTSPTPCCLDYASWHKVVLEVEVREMTIDDRRMDPISALEVMIVEIDWEKEGGFCANCVRAWKIIWTKDREKIWKNLGDWLGLDDVASES